MRAHYLQHVRFEGPGSIEPWLRAREYAITRSALYEAAVLPNPRDLDLLVILGGPMSVNDEIAYPWLAAEKRFIRATIASGASVLGICLGAQLIAASLGARVFGNREKEIGWYPVSGVSPEATATDSVRAGSAEPTPPVDRFRFPERFDAFHWHGETFDLPEGAVRLAETEVCRNQAFQIGARVIGLQFHLESTRESIGALVEGCRSELVSAAFVQSEAQILGADREAYRRINLRMAEVLDFLHARAARGPGRPARG